MKTNATAMALDCAASHASRRQCQCDEPVICAECGRTLDATEPYVVMPVSRDKPRRCAVCGGEIDESNTAYCVLPPSWERKREYLHLHCLASRRGEA